MQVFYSMNEEYNAQGALLPPFHPERLQVHEEIHARFYQALHPPVRLSWLALLSPNATLAQEREQVAALCRHFGESPELPEENFVCRNLGAIRLRWERHGEFSSWTFFIDEERAGVGHLFADPPIQRLPTEWLRQLPGEVIAAIHLEMLAREEVEPSLEELGQWFDNSSLVGSEIAGGDARAWGDFRIHEDGFSRFLIKDIDLTQRQAGRAVQRLLDIETYRLLALLAWPLARQVMGQLHGLEEELKRVSDELATLPAHADQPEQQQQLLASLSHLAAGVERLVNHSSTRFHASRAYAALVERRFEQMRIVRIHGLQTFAGFINRRLDPAMRTCASVAERLESLAGRISRTSDLLRTRVDVALERQNRDLLRSMNRRARLQLRLQETVEGLSVVVISYYLTSLLAYLLKGFEQQVGLPVAADVAIAASVPAVVVGVWLAIRTLRNRVMRKEG